MYYSQFKNVGGRSYQPQSVLSQTVQTPREKKEAYLFTYTNNKMSPNSRRLDVWWKNQAVLCEDGTGR